MGIGDHICLYGMVSAIIERENPNRVYLFCHKKNQQTLTHLYEGTCIQLIGVPDGVPEVDFANAQSVGMGKRLIRIGFNQYRESADMPCDQAFYLLAGVPYEAKYTRFSMKRNQEEESRVYSKLNPTNEDYIFVHDDPSRGFTISVNTDMKVLKNDMSESVFHFGKILENAKEFHCMESSFRCFSEHLDMSRVKLVFYDSLRPSKWKLASKHTWEFR